MSVIDSIPVEQLSVRVKNIGDRPFNSMYALAKYSIAPGEERVMPYLAACYFFGDPRSVNIGDPDQNRATQFRRGECERLSVMYGTYDVPWFADEPTLTPGGDDEMYMDSKKGSTGLEPYTQTPNRWVHPNLPRVVVLQGDTPLNTVLEDPEGDGMVKPDQSRLEVQTLRQEHEALKAKMDQLIGEIQMRDPVALDSPEHDPIDNIPGPTVESAPVGSDERDGIVDSLTDPEPEVAPAVPDTPRRPTPKRKTSSS